MKKILEVSMIGIMVCLPNCTHNHTEECGEDGIICTYECLDVETKSIQHPKR